jgi:predicted RecA/RadA family phage recombinase
MATFRNNGITSDHTPASNVTAGDVVVVGDRVCVADHDIAANEKGALTRRGIYRFNKATGSSSAIPDGSKVYYNAAEDIVTLTAGSNKVAGYAANGGAGDDDAFCDVELAAA